MYLANFGDKLFVGSLKTTKSVKILALKSTRLYNYDNDTKCTKTQLDSYVMCYF